MLLQVNVQLNVLNNSIYNNSVPYICKHVYDALHNAIYLYTYIRKNGNHKSHIIFTILIGFYINMTFVMCFNMIHIGRLQGANM